MFSVVNRGQLPGTTEHEIENLNSRLKGLWLTEHNEDGTHNIAAMDFSELRLQAGNISSGVFDASLIPNLDASKITSGTFAAARIPSLDASKITTGTFSDSLLSSNVALKNASNTFTQNQLISKTRPELQILSSGTSKGRIAANVADQVILSRNLSFDGTNWNLDDTTKTGAVWESDGANGFSMITASAGTNPRTAGTVIQLTEAGKIIERGRSLALGDSTAYTPIFTSSGGTPVTVGNGTVTGQYTRIGSLVVYSAQFTFGSTSSQGASNFFEFSLPVNADATKLGFIQGSARALKSGVAWHIGVPYLPNNGAVAVVYEGAPGSGWGAGAPVAWGSGDFIIVNVVYYT